MKHSLHLPFLSGWNVLQHRPQVGEKRGSLVTLLTEARQEGPSWSSETCYPIRSGGPGESCRHQYAEKQKQVFFIKAFIKSSFRFTAKLRG